MGVGVFCVSVFLLSVCVGVVCFLLVIVYQHFCFFVLKTSEFVGVLSLLELHVSQVVSLRENDQAAGPSAFRVGEC